MTSALRARLGAYLYVLRRVDVATSTVIGAELDICATQVRRDLGGVLGPVGKRGSGYRAVRVVPLLEAALDGDATGGAAIVCAAIARKLPAPAMRPTPQAVPMAAAILRSLDHAIAKRDAI